jgi:uncharacterized protein
MRRPLAVLLGGALALLAGALLARGAAELYTELLWFRHVGYGDVYATRLLTIVSVRGVAAALGTAVVLANLWFVIRQLGPVHLRRRYGNLEIAEQVPRSVIVGGVVTLAIATGLWLSGTTYTSGATLSVLTWLRHEPWGITEPLFGRDAAFYVFTLPVLYRFLSYLLVLALWSAVLAISGYALIGLLRLSERRLDVEPRAAVHLAVLGAGVVAVLAVRYWLGRYGFALQGTGFGGIVGYTDMHARLPVRTVLAVIGLGTAATIVYAAHRRSLLPPAIAMGALMLAVIAGSWIYPAIVQSLHVEPNQLAREAPYIRWHMQFTQRAFDLNRIRREQLVIEPRPFIWRELAADLERLPLWDRDVLRAVFEQDQAKRQYYHFPDVDFDRYGAPGEAWQVAIAVREFRAEGLPPQAQTWQTLHLNPEAVRGWGVVVTPTSGVRADPDLWVSDIEPVQTHAGAPPELAIGDPSIYFGETMTGYLVLGARTDDAAALALAAAPAAEPASDLPPARDTAIPLASFTRVLAFALRFGDHNLLFARELTRESRIVFRRGIRERLAQLAPFLVWDPDPYPVIHEERIVWIVDGYAATSSFPLAAAYPIEGVGRLRYARNAVKAVVDAATGDVALYAVQPDDPILATYARIFPGLFRDVSELAHGLRRHWRYPTLLLRMQADMLRSFHLDRPEPFFAGEDVWELPDERSTQGVLRQYRPLQLLLRLPGETRREFVSLFPFTLRERPLMVALLAARHDPPDYGELLLLELPRDQQVRGPALIASLVAQDPVIASQLALWRQTGEVNFGQLRVVPLEPGILYVQPLFLSAHGSPIPQLHRVIVSDGTRVRMANTLPLAVAALDGEGAPLARDVPTRLPDGPWAQEALELLDEAERRLRAGDWAGFGARWTELQRILRRAAETNPSH